MLVLTRKSQESIRIGQDITVTILRVKGKAVGIGVEAPNSVRVLRGELIDAKDQGGEPAKADNAAPAKPASPRVLKPRVAKRSRPGEQTAAKPSDWRPNRQPPASEPDVSFSRVSKSRVASVLPSMLGDAGPLRSMLNQRSAAGATT